MNCDQICQYNTLYGCKVKEYNGICPLANVNKPMTNADKIRAMSVEALANELIEYRDDWGDYCTHAGCYDTLEEALAAEIEWLQRPVGE